MDQKDTTQIRTRRLGHTNIRVSEIAFGCAAIGAVYGMNVRGAEDMLTDDQAVNLLNSALDRGINFFDTAPAYGRSEEILGKAFCNRRPEVVLSTKLSKSIVNDKGRLVMLDELRAVISQSLHNSLSRLAADHIDLLFVHHDSDEVIFSSELRAVLSELKSQGLVKAVGISTYGSDQTRKAIESGNWDVVQLALSMMDQRNAGLLPLAQERGVAVMARSVKTLLLKAE